MAGNVKKTVALCGAGVWASWAVLGVVNLWLGDISRVDYGCCWIVALVHIALYYEETVDKWNRLEDEHRKALEILESYRKDAESTQGGLEGRQTRPGGLDG